jgi:hypothetical protein
VTRARVARASAGLAALGFLGTAALHATGYGSIVRAASGVPGMVGRLMPALWLVVSVDLTVLGAIVGVLALRPLGPARPILAIVAVCPLAAAALQLRFIGFIPPTALLIGLGGLALATAAIWPAAAASRTAGE